MKKIVVLTLGAGLSFSGFAFSQEMVPSTEMPPSLKAVQMADDFEKARDASQEMDRILERDMKHKYFDCMKAVGNQKLCQCIQDNSPFGVNFIGYVTVVTNTKEELGYTNADTQTKLLIDNTLKTRERCVGGK